MWLPFGRRPLRVVLVAVISLIALFFYWKKHYGPSHNTQDGAAPIATETIASEPTFEQKIQGVFHDINQLLPLRIANTTVTQVVQHDNHIRYIAQNQVDDFPMPASSFTDRFKADLIQAACMVPATQAFMKLGLPIRFEVNFGGPRLNFMAEPQECGIRPVNPTTPHVAASPIAIVD